MDATTHKDIKFYFCVLISAALLFTAIFIPPVGIIETSVLYGGASFLLLAGVVEGVDVKGIIREVRLMKDINLNSIQASDEKNKNENLT